MSASTTRARKYDGGTPPFAVGPFGINVAYGWADGDDGAALRLGAAFMLLPPRFDPDVYVHVPRRALLGLDGGVGVAATTVFGPSVLSYAQLGSIHNATGLYVTGGYLHQFISADSVSSSLWLHDDGWLATLGYQSSRGVPVFHYFVTGVVGRRFARLCADAFYDCSMLKRPWSIMAGMTFEVEVNRVPRRR